MLLMSGVFSTIGTLERVENARRDAEYEIRASTAATIRSGHFTHFNHFSTVFTFSSPRFSPLSPFDPELRFARRRFTEHTRYRASRVERNGKKIDALEQIHKRD